MIVSNVLSTALISKMKSLSTQLPVISKSKPLWTVTDRFPVVAHKPASGVNR